MTTTKDARFQLKRDTAANWTANNLLLLDGEVGLEKDTGKRKTGNGVNTWNALNYDNVAQLTSTTQTIGVKALDFWDSNTSHVLVKMADGRITSEADEGGAIVYRYLVEEDLKTVGGQSIVGSGNIEASGGGNVHADSPASTLPSTSTIVGELFVRTGSTRPGLYASLDLVGNWVRLS